MGSVLNVVDFGAFVDIGLHDSGHGAHQPAVEPVCPRSARCRHRGQIVKVWVLELDKARRRVALTMIQPGSGRDQQPRREKPAGGERRSGRPQQAQRASQQPQRPAAGAETTPAPRPQRQRRGREQQPREPQTRTYTASAPAKPAKPLTKAMRDGKEPLRTFGDLKQFLEKQEDEKPD
jgi:protein Tex